MRFTVICTIKFGGKAMRRPKSYKVTHKHLNAREKIMTPLHVSMYFVLKHFVLTFRHNFVAWSNFQLLNFCIQNSRNCGVMHVQCGLHDIVMYFIQVQIHFRRPRKPSRPLHGHISINPTWINLRFNQVRFEKVFTLV